MISWKPTEYFRRNRGSVKEIIRGGGGENCTDWNWCQSVNRNSATQPPERLVCLKLCHFLCLTLSFDPGQHKELYLLLALDSFDPPVIRLMVVFQLDSAKYCSPCGPCCPLHGITTSERGFCNADTKLRNCWNTSSRFGGQIKNIMAPTIPQPSIR